jgi:hypothetical protein
MGGGEIIPAGAGTEEAIGVALALAREEQHDDARQVAVQGIKEAETWTKSYNSISPETAKTVWTASAAGTPAKGSRLSRSTRSSTKPGSA